MILPPAILSALCSTIERGAGLRPEAFAEHLDGALRWSVRFDGDRRLAVHRRPVAESRPTAADWLAATDLVSLDDLEPESQDAIRRSIARWATRRWRATARRGELTLLDGGES